MGEEKITYICKRTAVATRTVRDGLTHDLSPLDRLMEVHRIRAVYYYNTPLLEQGEMAKMLRESLSETLNHFPAICGRLVKNDAGEWTVRCNDAGVRMIEAKAKGSVQTWLDNATQQEEEQLLAHWEDMFHVPYRWSTFYIQLTEFEDGGLAVGLSCTHLLADPISVSFFIKAWADVTLHSKIFVPPFFHPLPPRRLIDTGPTTRPDHNLLTHYNSIMQSQTSATAQTCKTVTLLFSEPMVQACIEMAQYDPTQPKPSPFQSLAGLFWAAISRVKGCAIDMSICTDVRRILRLDKGFFGNCMVHTHVVGDGSDASNVAHAARIVGDAMNRIETQGVKDLIEWLNGLPCNLPQMDGGDHIVCMDLQSMDLCSFQFDSRFEHIRASYYVEPLFGHGRVLVLPSPQGQGELGRVVTVTLPGDQVHKLCQDVVISSLSPSILTN